MPKTRMTASEEQKTRTKAEEGVSLEAYADTQDPPVWTVGFGHAATNPIPVRGELDGEPYVGPPARGVSISIQEADRLFDEDAHEHEDAINSGVDSRVELTQGQFDALFDFCHHYGPSRFLGSTLLEKINFNPTATENIAAQFQRWNINAGRRDPAIYRRACRRACVYAGVPIPNLLWKTPQNGFPWKVSPDDEIDHSVTPTAFQFIQMGKKVATPYKFDPSEPISKPAPEVAAEPSGGVGGGQLGQPSAPPPIASAPSPDSAKPKPELVLKTPIPPVVKGSEGPPPVVKRPTVPPPVAAPVPSRVVILPQTVPIHSLPPTGTKNMADSERVLGMVLVGAGTLVQVITLRLGIGTAVGAIFFDLTRDPIVIALVCTGIVAALGWATKRNGKKTFSRGADNAQGGVH